MKLYAQKEELSVSVSADILESFLALVAAKEIQNPEAAVRALPSPVIQAFLNFGPKEIEAAIAEARKSGAHNALLEKTTEKAPPPAPVVQKAAPAPPKPAVKPVTPSYKPATPPAAPKGVKS